MPGGLSVDKDEKTFLLDKSLHLRTEDREAGEKVLAWRDLSGDDGDLYEFLCDSAVKDQDFATFQLVAIKCQYERRYRKPNEEATEKELEQFNFSSENIPDPSPVSSPTSREPKPNPLSSPTSGPSKRAKEMGRIAQQAKESTPTAAPPAEKHPEPIEVMAKSSAELHLFDFESSTFVLQDNNVIAVVSEVGKWQYWLQISGEEREWLGQPVVADVNPVFNFEYLSFIFNHYTADGSAYSWLLRFKDQATLEHFQEGVMQALWEQLNEMKWSKVKKDDQDYVFDAFKDLNMDDVDQGEESEEEEHEDHSDGQRSEHYDTDEEHEDVEIRDKDGNVNSQLAVGTSNDRSFVVRGSKIGVFTHTPSNNLEFSTNISKVETSKGKLFSPKKVMLHMRDRDMILQNPDNPHALYQMDLESGKIVNEYKIHDDIPVKSFNPSSVS